jgi:hypothetical protein
MRNREKAQGLECTKAIERAARIVFGALYFYDHPEAFDAFLYWSIGHYYRH